MSEEEIAIPVTIRTAHAGRDHDIAEAQLAAARAAEDWQASLRMIFALEGPDWLQREAAAP